MVNVQQDIFPAKIKIKNTTTIKIDYRKTKKKNKKKKRKLFRNIHRLYRNCTETIEKQKTFTFTLTVLFPVVSIFFLCFSLQNLKFSICMQYIKI